MKVAAPVYLDWSDKPITFDQADHPDHVPSPGKYPLVVDPVVGDVRLTKVLMDGGSCLNIIYAETLKLLRVDPSSVRAGAAPFHGIIHAMGLADTVYLVGFDSNVATVEWMQSGIVDALIVQNPYAMGYLGVESAYRLLSGQGGSLEKTVDTATRTVTYDNMFTMDSQKALFSFE